MECTAKPVGTVIESGAQVQQVINLEVLSEFTEAPILHIGFMYVSIQSLML